MRTRGSRQVFDVERVGVEVVVAATPVDLARLLSVSTPIVRARYEFAETGTPTLGGLVDDGVSGLPRGARAAPSRREG